MYKWVDDKGVVHYTDKIPPEAVDKANTELSKEGIPVKKTDKVLTPEQRRAIAEEQEKKRLAARQVEEVAHISDSVRHEELRVDDATTNPATPRVTPGKP